MCTDIADVTPLPPTLPLPLFERAISGIRRLGLSLDRLRDRGRSYPVRVETTHGVTLLADPHDWVDRTVMDHGFYEPEVFEALASQLRSNDVFWDVGANIGLQALSVRHKMPSVRTVCFEPSPFAFGRLVWNARANHAADVTLLNIALSDHDGYAPLDVCLCGNGGATAIRSSRGRGIFPNHHLLLCRIESAQSVVRGRLAPWPNVVKIDVEGHEESVLRGFGDLLYEPTLRAIVVESWTAATMLESCGFNVRELPKAHDRDNGQANYLAVRA